MFPSFIMDFIFKSLSKSTILATLPGAILPNLSYIPIAFAGLTAADLRALSSGFPFFNGCSYTVHQIGN